VTLNQIFSGRTLIVGFDGWSDSADAASGAVRYLTLQSKSEMIEQLDSEEYYDYIFTRPQVSLDEDGQRQIAWPTAEFFAPSLEDGAPQFAKLFFLLGSEPSRRWKAFVSELMEIIVDQEIQAVVFLGSIPADTPHTRPVPVSAHSQNQLVREQTGAEKSNYQGPVGVQSVLSMELEAAGIPTLALWASVPHYVQNGPSPKAMLALVSELEKYLGIQFDHKDLATEAFTWERSIDELAENDEDMAGYIEQLEQTRDATDSEAASGDSLAMEFEKFLASQSDKTEGESGDSSVDDKSGDQ
jgi:proteasome assembly chaperone (PAC2) family protein